MLFPIAKVSVSDKMIFCRRTQPSIFDWSGGCGDDWAETPAAAELDPGTSLFSLISAYSTPLVDKLPAHQSRHKFLPVQRVISRNEWESRASFADHISTHAVGLGAANYVSDVSTVVRRATTRTVVVDANLLNATCQHRLISLLLVSNGL